MHKCRCDMAQGITHYFQYQNFPGDITQPTIVAAQNKLKSVFSHKEVTNSKATSAVAAVGEVEACHHHLQVSNIICILLPN